MSKLASQAEELRSHYTWLRDLEGQLKVTALLISNLNLTNLTITQRLRRGFRLKRGQNKDRQTRNGCEFYASTFLPIYWKSSWFVEHVSEGQLKVSFLPIYWKSSWFVKSIFEGQVRVNFPPSYWKPTWPMKAAFGTPLTDS
jgi:hypothetical protein